MTPDIPPPERFLKLDEVKRRAGLRKSMIYRLIQEGRFPAPYKLSPAAARWIRAVEKRGTFCPEAYFARRCKGP